MDWFKLVYTLLGGLGIFFFGMKLMSEGLQSAASDWIRKVIGLLTKNRIIAVIVGLVVTTVVQSSSITTVMVIGFVNAGLMELSQAIGLVLGANIGTTITGWIISIKIGKYSLLLIGLGFVPMLFSKRDRWVMVGKILFALGLVFFGLETMSHAFVPLRSNGGFLSLMTYFQAESYVSLLGTVLVGCLLTMVVQSSSAMLGITIALAASGAISFQTALALVLGENIGTTITAILASIGANVNARRTAMAHATFNIVGVFVMTLFFWHYKDFIEWLVEHPADFRDEAGGHPFAGLHIAAGHSVFNVVNVIIFLPLIQYLEKLVCYLVPAKPTKEIKHLELFGNLSTLSAPMAIAQVQLELVKMAEMVQKILSETRIFLFDKNASSKNAEQVSKLETITDNIQMEITVFLGQVMQASLTHEDTEEVKKFLRVADELESIADYCLSIVKYKQRSHKDNVMFDAETNKELMALFDKVQELYALSNDTLVSGEKPLMIPFKEMTMEFNAMADSFKEHHLNRISSGVLTPLASLIVSDTAVAMRRLKNHTVNFAEALNYGKNISAPSFD